MQLFTDLFTTDYGRVALAATVVSLALALAMRLFIVKKMRESEATHPQPQTSTPKEHPFQGVCFLAARSTLAVDNCFRTSAAST
jgi:putative copper export protein